MTRIGAWVGTTVAYRLTGHRRLWLDGLNGTLTARMKDPDGPGELTAPRAQGGNPPWDSLSSLAGRKYSVQLISGTAAMCSLRGRIFSPILTMALRWSATIPQTKYRDGAVYWMENAERIAETLACDETASSCGDATDQD